MMIKRLNKRRTFSSVQTNRRGRGFFTDGLGVVVGVDSIGLVLRFFRFVTGVSTGRTGFISSTTSSTTGAVVVVVAVDDMNCCSKGPLADLVVGIVDHQHTRNICPVVEIDDR